MLLPLVVAVVVPDLLASPLPASQDEPPATQEHTLPESVVTARKWREITDDVPASVSSLDSEDLDTAGVQTIRDASLRVPNLFLTEFSRRRLSFPTIRGIGSGQGDPAVVTYIDGVPQLTVNSTNLPLFDVERVEILRGPHSTLYGRNAMGGVIHILSEQPTGFWEGDAQVTLGNYNLQEYSLWGGGPITADDLFFRAGAQHSRRDGYTTNDYTGNDVDYRNSWYGRGSILWTPSDEAAVTVSLYGESARDGGFVLSELQGLRQNPYHINQDYEGAGERDILAPSITWTQGGEDVEFTSVSAYQDWSFDERADFDFSPIDGIRRHSTDSQGYFNQEFRFSSTEDQGLALSEDSVLRAEDDSSVRWLAGVNAFVSDSSRSGATEYRPGGAGILFPPENVGTDTQSGAFDDWGVALFGQVGVPLGAGFDLGAGLRFDHENQDADLRRTFETGGMTVLDDRTSLSQSFDEFVPEVSLSKGLGESAMAYTRLARGFKAGGFNLAAPTDQLAFDPESSWSWELGAKSSHLEDRLHFNAAIFYIDWSDMQLSLFDSATGGYVDNVGAATSKGFEAEVRGEPLEDLDLFGGFGYTDATFDQYTDPYGQNVAGHTLPFVPETTWNVGGTYSKGPARNHRWFLYSALVGVGPYYYDAGNRERESFYLLDLRAGLIREHWKVELWWKNALDADYVQVAFQPSPADPTTFVGENGAPTTFGVTLGASF